LGAAFHVLYKSKMQQSFPYSARRTTATWCRLAFAVLATIGFAGSAHAVVLDWSSQPWTAGTLSNSYDIDPSATGSDVTISLSGFTEMGSDPVTGQLTPAINQSLTGGVPAQNILEISPDFTRDGHTLTFTITFSTQYTQGVGNVSFSIFDIDANSPNFVDEVTSIHGTALDGAQVAATITNVGSNVSVTGTALTTKLAGIGDSADAGAGSGAGNATISFGPAVGLRSVTFTLGTQNGLNQNPDYQNFGITNISFAPVPEINPAFAGGLCCAAVGMLARRRRKARRLVEG
jgi:hypothetical protein